MVELHFSERPPSTNELYFNLPRGGRALTESAKAWRTLAGLQLNRQHPDHIRGPVRLDIAIADKGKGDLDNTAKCLIDVLVGYGVIEQDTRAIVRAINLYWADVEGCRVRITQEKVRLKVELGNDK
jgi:Holliday junction resolvase RusA-like endonuclease